jgi:cation diffusion facilitator CzcD-associated flavoprotein CzcO
MEPNKNEFDELAQVCIVGSGALGLVAAKNLLEQGLDVQVFEKNEYVGGIWHASPDQCQTSALLETRAQGSKQLVRSSTPAIANCTLLMTPSHRARSQTSLWQTVRYSSNGQC